ncbi:hypothetical protein ACFY3V_33785 [Streptosporangium sp. NPDC000095]|uniref:hypothetical protein n=1 Tax=Streptosporangium sp. NPDC000095 TaxID=3366184 RepID=UPI0036BD38FA
MVAPPVGCEDPEVSAGLTEDFPPEEMADFISSGHRPAWPALMAKNRDQTPPRRDLTGGRPCTPSPT